MKTIYVWILSVDYDGTMSSSPWPTNVFDTEKKAFTYIEELKKKDPRWNHDYRIEKFGVE